MIHSCYYYVNISLFLLVTLSVFLFGSIGITNAYAEYFSYVDQLRYSTLSEKMAGHVIASYKNLSEGNKKLAQLHLTHPLEEEFESMSYFYDNYIDFGNKVEYILYVVSNVSENREMIFDKQAKEILFLAKQGKSLIIDDELLQDKYFNLLTASSLLESSKIELIESENSFGRSILLEYQDAFGFAVRAHMILDNINELPPEFKSDIEDNYVKLFYAFGNSKDIKQIMQIEEDLILEIYDYILKHEPRFQLPINGQVEKERTVLLKTSDLTNQKLVIFVGENFPKNSHVTITYTSSKSNTVSTLDVSTTDDGEFNIPVEFASEHVTYFVQVTCSELTTSHMISNDL